MIRPNDIARRVIRHVLMTGVAIVVFGCQPTPEPPTDPNPPRVVRNPPRLTDAEICRILRLGLTHGFANGPDRSSRELSVSELPIRVVSKPLALHEHDLQSVSQELQLPRPKLRRIITAQEQLARRWSTGCGIDQLLARIDEGADVSGVFPTTPTHESRAEVSWPIRVSADQAFCVVISTNGKTYYYAELLLFAFREDWELVSAVTLCFA